MNKFLAVIVALLIILGSAVFSFAEGPEEPIFDPEIEITENESSITIIITDESGTLEEYTPMVHIPCDYKKIKVTKDGTTIESVIQDGEVLFTVSSSGKYVIYDVSEDVSQGTGASYSSSGSSRSNVEKTLPFVDISKNDEFYDAALWAYINGITEGFDETHFGPGKTVTRGQMVTFLWRAAGCPDPEISISSNPFMDVKPTSKFYKAILWAVEKGITKGTTATTFNPGGTLSRAQAITFFARMSGIDDNAELDYAHNFTDVKPTKYYSNAVSWAVENGIAEGKSDTMFGSGNFSPRSEVVTFLWKYFVK